MTVTYVAVHGGAGTHSQSSDRQVKQALQEACSKALTLLIEGGSAIQAVEKAITVLEDDECLNAGCGSNLTLEGNVECDASIMDGRTGDFGSVGAVPGVKNPISAARAVLEHSRNQDHLGRIPPLMLVSEGALAFAASRGVDIVLRESLVSPRAMSDWRKWIQRLESTNDILKSPEEPGLHDIQDTVGAVAWDSEGGLAAGVSSGGLLLKYPGRIGEAAIFGAGCWAQQSAHNGTQPAQGIACSVSGAGESITRVALARSIGETLKDLEEDADIHEIIQQVLVDRFQSPLQARGYLDPDAGVLLIAKEQNDEGIIIPRLWCAFTTESMAIAYASSRDTKPKATILRRPQTSRSGRGPSIFITALPLGKS